LTSKKQGHQENAGAIHAELLKLLEGMDYCLDWKLQDSDWSAREVVYHLLDTPPGGTHAVVRGLVSGEITEYEIWSDLTNMTPERSGHDMEQITANIGDFFGNMNEALNSAAEADLDGKSVMVHQRTRESDEERTLEDVLAGFDRHWRAHLSQINELRDALGF
jgi:hypothetical protein